MPCTEPPLRITAPPPAAPAGGPDAGAADWTDRLVGREHELACLEAALVGAFAGRGTVCVVAGEPGIGKTRLVTELAERAQRRGATVALGRAAEVDGAPAFWPWTQVLRSFAESSDRETLRADMGAGAADIVHALPELASLLPSVPPSAALPPAETRFRLFDSVGAFLQATSRRRPLVIVLEDIHWADGPSLALLEFVARELAESPTLVLATCRDGEARAHAPLSRTLGELVRLVRFQRLSLGGLDAASVGALLAAASGHTDASLAAAVHAKSDGNPLFVRELVRLLVQDGGALSAAAVARLPAPRGVQDLLQRQLDRLSPACSALLRVAAVVGRDFEVPLLARLAGLEPARVLELLEEATFRDLVRPVRGALDRYAFAHALVRDALYDVVGAAERSALHRHVGETLEALHDRDPEAHLSEIAHHFLAAATAADLEKAVTYAHRAGDRHGARVAWEEAAANYACALAAHDRLAGAAPARRVELLLALGDAQQAGGDFAAARDTFQRAAAAARELAAPDLLARAALGVSGTTGSVGRIDEAMVRLLEDALAHLPPGDDPLRARVLAALAVALYWTPQVERMQRLSAEALAVAERTGDPQTLGVCLEARRHALWGPAHLEERLELANAMLAVAERTGDRAALAAAQLWRIVDLLELGDVETVERALPLAIRLAREIRDPVRIRDFAIIRAALALILGRLEEAESLIHEAYALGVRLNPDYAEQVFLMQTTALHREQGRLAESFEAMRAWASAHDAPLAWKIAVPYALSQLRRKEEARAAFEAVAAADFADVPRDYAALVTYTMLAETVFVLGDARRAAQVYELMLPYQGRNVVIGPGLLITGAAAANLGQLAATMERWADAERHFEDALAFNKRIGAFGYACQIRRSYAIMLLARRAPGDVARAQAQIVEARPVALALGMRSMVADLDALAREVADTHEAALPSGPPIRCFFRREGDHWTIGLEDAPVRLRDTKGLHYVARLLQHPGRSFPAAELADAFARPGTPPSDRVRARSTVTKRIRDALRRIVAADARLSHILAAAVKTGYDCAYRPDPTRPVDWTL